MRIWHDLHGDSGAPLLVLPCSLGTSRELWDPAPYARHFRVLRYEHRGHGESDTPPGPYTVEELAGDALDLLDELGVARASWIGLSLGGMVAMWIAACAPERLERLVLACTSARVPSPQAYAARAGIVREQGLEPVADAVVSRWFTSAAPAALRARSERSSSQRRPRDTPPAATRSPTGNSASGSTTSPHPRSCSRAPKTARRPRRTPRCSFDGSAAPGARCSTAPRISRTSSSRRRSPRRRSPT